MSTSVSEAEGATSKAGGGNDEEWTNHYGALILFFEENGHTNVPDSQQELHRWTNEQRAKYSELSVQQTRQLRLLDFNVPGAKARHCSHGECEKYAPFEGHCHAHAAKSASAKNTFSMLPKAPKATKSSKKRKAPVPKPEFPLIGIKKRKNDKYDIENKQAKVKGITREEVISRLVEYVETLAKMPCINSSNKTCTTTCTCLQFLEDKPFLCQSLSHALMDYCDLPALQRKHYAVERLRHAEMGREQKHYSKGGPQRIFFLPLSYAYLEEHHLPDGDDGEEGDGTEDNANKKEVLGQAFKHRICSHAFHNLHNIGPHLRQTLNKYVEGDIAKGQHGGAGKKWAGGKKYIDAYSSVRDKLNYLTEEYREYCDQKGDITLPIEISRRNTFERWCQERGWIVTKTNPSTGQYSNSDHYDVLPGFYKTEEEAIADGEDARSVAKVIFSWSAFNKFWNEEFPHLKTQARVGKGRFGGNYCAETKRYYPRSGSQAREITPRLK